MSSANGHAGYRVEIDAPAAVRIEALRDRAFARRLARSYTDDLEAVLVRLAKNPHGWGRLVADHGSLGLTFRRGRSVFLSVEYSVDERLREVRLHRVRASPRGPLA